MSGSFSATETWLAIDTGTSGVAGSAVEDFTVNVRKSNEDDLTTVSIEGTIRGLETRTYGTAPGFFQVTQTKDEAAQAYWNVVKDRIAARANYVAGALSRPLNIISPMLTSLGRNPTAGTISYTYEFNNRPSNCIEGSIFEMIRINDVDPIDVFASIPIPGRANGPILQDINTVTSPTREVSIEVKMPPATSCPTGTTQVTTLLAASPKAAVQNLIDQFEEELKLNYSQVFKSGDSGNLWEPKTGQFNRTVNWTMGNC
jgi:hypothetical protein